MRGISVVLVSVVAGNAIGQQPASPKPISRDSFAVLMASVSNAGRWGPNDELGTLNLITPDVRRAAAQRVRDGVTVSLSRQLVAGPDANAIAPLRFGLSFGPNSSPDSMVFGVIDTFAVIAHGFSHSHIDGLGHFAYRGKLYNGQDAHQLRTEGAQVLAIDRMSAGIVTRGVIVDLPRFRGVGHLALGTGVTPEDLEAWERRSGVRIQSGDVVLIRTGRDDPSRGEPLRVAMGTAGPHPLLVAWLKSRGVAVLGSDVGNDMSPSLVEGVSYPVHLLSLVGLGMPLLDNLDLEAVASEAVKRSRPTFMFVAAPLRIRGGTGSLVNPLAIF